MSNADHEHDNDPDGTAFPWKEGWAEEYLRSLGWTDPDVDDEQLRSWLQDLSDRLYSVCLKCLSAMEGHTRYVEKTRQILTDELRAALLRGLDRQEELFKRMGEQLRSDTKEWCETFHRDVNQVLQLWLDEKKLLVERIEDLEIRLERLEQARS